MTSLTSPKKFYKRVIPILVKSRLYVLDNTDYLNDQWYGNSYGKWTWRIYIDVTNATLQREHNITGLKWIWKYGEDS